MAVDCHNCQPRGMEELINLTIHWGEKTAKPLNFML